MPSLLATRSGSEYFKAYWLEASSGAALKLGSSFFRRDTIRVAEELVGKILFFQSEHGLLSGRIVETEAYLGVDDPACHTWKGRQTDRVQPMWEDGGLIYVYLIYGMYNCLNFVTARKGQAEAVLIRAVEPLSGQSLMWKRRPKARDIHHLCRGPGCLTQAFGIDRSLSGCSLGETLWVESAKSRESIVITSDTRVGIDYAGDAIYWPLRFFLQGNPCVSRTKLVLC